MPILTISQLTKVVTRDEALTSLLTMLQGFGFNTTSWQTGSIQRSLVEIGAEIWSQASGTVATITNNGFNQLATKEGLTQFSDSVYDNQREEATPTQGTMRLTETAGGGPYVVAVGDSVAVDDLTGATFRNTTGGPLNPSSTRDLTYQAEAPGEAGNIDAGATLSLQVPIVGVTVTNPAIAPSTTWITAWGQNEESDAKLKTRNRSKWPNLSINKPEDAYIGLALEAPQAAAPNLTTGITKAAVDSNNPGGIPGALDVYIANDLTGPNATQLADVDAYLQARRAVSAFPLQTFGAPQAFLDVRGTIFYRAGASAEVVGAAVQNAMTDYLTVFPLEGYPYAPSAKGLALNELRSVLTSVTDVLNVTLVSPVIDTSLGGSFAQLVLLAPLWQVGGPNSMTFTAV